MAAIDELLRLMLEKGGSDLHLTVGLPPKARISGALQPIGDRAVGAQAMEAMLREICPEKRWADFLDRHLPNRERINPWQLDRTILLNYHGESSGWRHRVTLARKVDR